MRSDGRKEYFSGQFHYYLQQMGIRHEINCKYTLEQNGIGERKSHLVMEAAHAMPEEKSMPKFDWAEAVRTAFYIHNRIGEKVFAPELYFE